MNEVPGYREHVRRLLASATLVCGAEMDTLLEQVADGYAEVRNEHQRECVYCRAALGQLAVMWAPVAEAAAAPVPEPPELTAAVTSQLRPGAEDVWYLPTTGRGAVRIAAQTVTSVACDAARRVPAVQAVFGRATSDVAGPPADQSPAAPGATSAAVTVDLSVTTSGGRPTGEVARDVQQSATAALRKRLSMAAAVNVAVDQAAGM